MNRLVSTIVLGALCFSWSMPSAWAIKQFGDQFKEKYTKDNENEEFVKLVKEANCFICHVDGEKKDKRNEYGQAVATLLKKADFPPQRFKDEPEKCKEEIDEALKKVEEMKDKNDKMFGDKIREGVLPGGDVKGK